MTSDHAPEGRSKFDLGIAEIDAQHHAIKSLLERLRNATDKHYGFATNAILDELHIQTRINFAVEESLMRLLYFPETDAHVLEHRHLTEQLEKFIHRAQDFDVSEGLSSFIQTWLIDHIDNHDRKFAAYFLKQGID